MQQTIAAARNEAYTEAALVVRGTVLGALLDAAKALEVCVPMVEAVCTYDPTLIVYCVAELADPATDWLENPRSGPRNKLFLEGHNVLHRQMTMDELIGLPLHELFVFLPRLLPGSCGQTSKWLFLLSTSFKDDSMQTVEFTRDGVRSLIDMLSLLRARWCLRVRYGGHSIMVEGVPDTQEGFVYQSFFGASSLSDIVHRGEAFPLPAFLKDLSVLLSANACAGTTVSQAEYARLESRLLMVFGRLGTTTYDKIVTGEEEPNAYELCTTPLPASEVVRQIIADYSLKLVACQANCYWHKSASCLLAELGIATRSANPKEYLQVRIAEFEDWDRYVWYNCRSHPPLTGCSERREADCAGNENSALVVPMPPQTNGSANWHWYVLYSVTASHYNFVLCSSPSVQRTCFPRNGYVCQCVDPPAMFPTASCAIKYRHRESGLWAGATEPLQDAIACIELQ